MAESLAELVAEVQARETSVPDALQRIMQESRVCETEARRILAMALGATEPEGVTDGLTQLPEYGL